MTPDSAPISATRRWAVVCLLSLGMVIAYVDRANLSVVLALKDFVGQFHLSDLDRGFLNSAFFWSYAFLQIPSGWIVDRYGTKLPYALAFLFWGLTSAATGLVQNISQLTAARLLLGVGESISTPASLRWIRFHCAEEQRGLATGILFSGAKVGAALGVPVAAFLVARFGWRAMFVVLGFGGLLWLAAWFPLLRNEPRRSGTASMQADQSAIGIPALLKTPAMWGVLLGTFAYNYFIYFCLTWLPAYLMEARHLSLSSMGVYTMFSFGGMAVVGVSAGWLSDRLISQGRDPVRVRKMFTLLGFIAASTEIFGGLSHTRSVAVFFALFSLSGLGLATANYWALTQTLVPKASIGRATGLQNFASNCSGIVAPILTGWLKEVTGSYAAPMGAVLGVLLLGVFSYGFLVRRQAWEGIPAKGVEGTDSSAHAV